MGAEMRAGDPSNLQKVADWWSDEAPSQPGIQWIEVPQVERNVNLRGTGDPNLGWVDHSARFLESRPRPRRLLSVGCGFGVIERLLRQKQIGDEIDGVDVAPGAIEGARKQAADEGLTGLNYWVADLNTCTLPEAKYDAVYAHAALHHVFNLEHLLDQIKRSLVPGGIFVIFDYVGPSQMQFPRAHLDIADVFLRTLPPEYRRFRRWEGIKEEALRLPLSGMNESDPSEGVRAHEIVPLALARFHALYLRPVGGSLLMLVLNEIAGNLPKNDAHVDRLLESMIFTENLLIDSGVLPSYHVYLVCQKTDAPCVAQTQPLSILGRIG